MKLTLTGIRQIAIPVHDIARAKAFYENVLGLKFLMEAPNMAFFDCGGVRLYLDASGAGAQGAKAPMIYFAATNLQEQFAALKENGAEVFQEPHIIADLPDREIWLLWFYDPERNQLAIMEERKK